MTIKAHYIGMQEGCDQLPAIELWNLDEDIPNHPKGSTVSLATISEANELRQAVAYAKQFQAVLDKILP